METVVKIDGKEMKLKTSAALPRLYRLLLGREIFVDMHNMTSIFSRVAAAAADKKKEAPTQQEQLEALTMLENITFVMNKHGDPSQPNTVEAWLEQFGEEDALANAGVLGTVVSLWNHETETTAEEKKKKRQIDRRMTTGLYLLRATQCGIAVRDLELLSIGMVYDMFTESQNDGEEYDQLATQADIDRL